MFEDITTALEYIEGNIGAAYEMEIVPRWIDDHIEYSAVLRDEHGEAADAFANTMADAIIRLAKHFSDWLDEQD